MSQKTVSPADVPLNIRELAENPIPGAVAPPGAVSLMSTSEVGARIEAAKKALSHFSLLDISGDPNKALAVLNLQEKLAVLDKMAAEREVEAQSKLRMLQEVERWIADRHAEQNACERVGHIRENGSSAISGQTAGNGQYCLVCIKCQKLFIGIGEGEGELPSYIANRVDWANVGKG